MVEADGDRWPAFGPRPRVIHYPPWATEMPTLRCPSDPGRGLPSLGRTNYAACIGDGFYDSEEGATVWTGSSSNGRWLYRSDARAMQRTRCGLRGAFVTRYSTRFRDFTDGLSNTIAVGEIMTGLLDDDNRTVGTQAPSKTGSYPASAVAVGSNPDQCSDLGFIDVTRPNYWDMNIVTVYGAVSRRGFRWADFHPLQTQFNTILAPNSEVCLAGASDTYGVAPPSSRHLGGCHVLMADGAVVFITDSIEAGDPHASCVYCDMLSAGHNSSTPVGSRSPYGLWGALGTRASNETIDQEF